MGSLQCSRVRRLFDKNFCQKKYLCKNFKFHSSLDLRKSRLRKFPKYYPEMLYKSGKFLSSFLNLHSTIISQFIWFNKKIQIDKTHVFFSSLSDKGLNFVDQLFDRTGSSESCEYLKDELSLTNNEKFKLFQIIHALPKQWREIVATYDGNLSNVFFPDHNLIKKNQVYSLSKLGSKELYKIQVFLKYTKPTSQHYFEKHFSQSNIDSKKNYILPRVVTVDNRVRVFQ